MIGSLGTEHLDMSNAKTNLKKCEWTSASFQLPGLNAESYTREFHGHDCFCDRRAGACD